TGTPVRFPTLTREAASVVPSRLSPTQLKIRSPDTLAAVGLPAPQVRSRWPLRVSQTCTAPFPAPHTRSAPSVEKASDVAPPTWPPSVAVTVPVRRSRSRTLPSVLPLASADPSGAIASANTSVGWSLIVQSGAPETASQRWTTPAPL